MPALTECRGSQNVQVSEFIFNYNDTALDSIDGASKTFGSAYTDALVFDCINLPPGAIVCGGEILVQTAYSGPTASTISIGVEGATTALANAVSLLVATRTELNLATTAPFVSNNGANIRITLAHTVANAITGKVRIRVMYTIDGRQNVVNPN